MKPGFLKASFGLLLVLLSGCAPGENSRFSTSKGAAAMDNMEIDQAIELATDARHRQFLSDFKKRFPPEDNMRVTSRGPDFEIIVSHASRDNYTGGAEQYFLDKQTGRFEMGWHEHPMPLDIPEQ